MYYYNFYGFTIDIKIFFMFSHSFVDDPTPLKYHFSIT